MFLLFEQQITAFKNLSVLQRINSTVLGHKHLFFQNAGIIYSVKREIFLFKVIFLKKSM
jgi:hypothetical protein